MSLSPIEQKFRRDLDPVMQRAQRLGEALRIFPYERIDATEYVRLGKLVREIEKFLGKETVNITVNSKCCRNVKKEVT
jgi:hypothetical protein